MNLKQMIFYNKLKKGNKSNCDFRFKGGVVYSTLNEDQLNLPEKYQIIDGKVYYKDKPICEFKQSDDISMDTFEISDSFIEEATKDKKEKKEEVKSESESKEEKKEEVKSESESKEEKKEETKSESESKEEKEAEEDEDEYEDEIDFTKIKRLFFPVRRLFGKIKNIFTKKEFNIEIPEEVKKEENKDDKDKKDSKKEETKNKEKTSEKKETKETEEFNKNKEEATKLIQKIVDELNEIHKITYSRKDLDFSSENDEIKEIRSFADKAYYKLQNNKKVNLDELKEYSIKAETVKKRMLATSNNNPKVEPIDFSKEESKATKEEPKKEETKTTKEESKATKEESKKEETKTTKEEPKKEETKSKASKKDYSVNDIKNTIESYDKKAKHFKEIEEKIAYYEEFLNTHDLSHADDQGMKQRMEEKLNNLRNEYSALKSYNDSHKNEIIDEKMAFYTQSAMGIDKNIDKLEKERQYKILKAELEGKSIVNLGLAEERKIDAKKAELLRLKEECLRRKAEENKYYEEIAARMTSALKR